MADYPGAIEMYVPRYRTFIDAQPKDVIVLHKTAGFHTIEELGNYFATNTEVTSSHFGVGLDGRVAQFVLLSDGSGANCCVDHEFGRYDHAFWDPYVAKYDNLNLCSLTIEHIDSDTSNRTTPPQAQKDASFKLVKWLMDRYNIAFDHVKGHNSIDGTNRANCPGNYPWSELQAYVEGNDMKVIGIQDVADHFDQTAPNMWVCKQTRYVIGNAILTEYQRYGGDQLCGVTYLGLPLGNEVGIGGGRTWQKFERGILVYDPQFTNDLPAGHDRSRPVYSAHLDAGFGLSAYRSANGSVDPRIASYLTTADESIQAAKGLLPK